MTEVEIKTSDGEIWQRDKVIVELIQASFKGPVIINLLREGPCCQTVGLESMLDLLVEKFQFSRNLYTIKTCNQVPSSRYNEQRQSFIELEFMQKNALEIQHKDIDFQKHFGMFVSRSNWLRLAIASYCYDKYQDRTLMTYHYDRTSDYHVCHFGLEKFLNKHLDEIDQVSTFLKKIPIAFEDHCYPIQWNQRAVELNALYPEFFCDIVCETYFSGRVFFMTEKIMRSIINKKPFLVQGPQWFLKNLKKLGFQTFDRWWDEGYDEDPWDFRYQGIKINIDYIANQSLATVQQWHTDMKPVLDHNYDTFLKLTPDQILKTDFYV